MNKKANLLIMIAILIVPIALFQITQSFSDENSAKNSQAIGANKPQVIDFTSSLCLECKELEKVINPVKGEYKNKIIFKKVLINSRNAEVKNLMRKYDVKVVPTLVFLNKEGKVARKTEGSMPKAQLKTYLDQLGF